jgi:hypothetical protein
MKRLNRLSAAVACLGLTAACGGGERAANVERDSTTAANTQAETAEPTGRNVAITVTGCLSSAEGRYVLTELESADRAPAQPTTETYELTDADDQLQQHVGKQVRINGQAEPARIAEVRESTPSTPATATGTAGQQSRNQPAVSTETRARLEMRKMSVMAVTPTGDDCPTATTPAR